MMYFYEDLAKELKKQTGFRTEITPTFPNIQFRFVNKDVTVTTIYLPMLKQKQNDKAKKEYIEDLKHTRPQLFI